MRHLLRWCQRLGDRRVVLLGLLAWIMAASPVRAGDEPEHYHLVYTVARTIGFNDRDARIVASASWSLDLNDDTTAYNAQRGDTGKVVEFLTGVAYSNATDRTALDELFSRNGLLSHAPKGMMFHALGSEASRRAVDAYWQRTLADSANRPREEQLVLVGMYLHFVVDRHVHPADSIVGHFWDSLKGDNPDFASNNPVKLHAAAGEVFAVLRKTAEQVGVRDAANRPIDVDERLQALELATTDSRQQLYAGIISALSRAYALGNAKAVDGATQELRRSVGSRFARVGETFGILPVEGAANNNKYAFVYTSRPDGSLAISGPLLPSGTTLTIRDPVQAVKSAFGTDGLAAAKRDVVGQVKNYYSNAAVIAVSAAAPGLHFDLVALATVDKAARLIDEYKDRVNMGTVISRGADAGIRVYQRAADGTVKLWQQAGDKLQVVEKAVGRAAVASEIPLRRALSEIARGPAVGGVRLDYSADLLAALEQRAGGSETDLVRVDARVRLVSLQALLRAIKSAGGRWQALDEATRSLGGINRIFGYLIEPTSRDVILIGGVMPDAPAIRTDDLVSGLRQVYREGVVPMVSLDPDPGDFSAPQKVRLIGIAAESHFARIMVDADYQMKKLTTGVVAIRAGDFRSAAELALDGAFGSAATSAKSRYWLTPVQPGPSDIQVSQRGGEALFLGRIQVLTEALELTSAGLQATGQADPVSDEAARLFTRNYQAIAAQYPIFRSLEGLNDIVLLATVLSKAGIGEKVLTELAAMTIRTDEPGLPKSLPAVAHMQTKGAAGVVMVGGVNLRPVALKSKWARQQDRQLMQLHAYAGRLARSQQLFINTNLESLVISPPRGKRGEVEVLIERGSRNLAARHYEDADKDFSRAIKLDPGATEGFVGRAIANAALRNSRRAFRDARHALELDPQDDDVAAMKLAIGLESGQDLSVVFGASDATPAAKSRAAGLFIKRGVARAAARKTTEAEQDFTWALSIEPRNAEAYMLRGALKVELAVAADGTKLFDVYKMPAREDLDQSIKLDPAMGAAYTARSKLNLFDGNIGAAIDDASAAIRIDPKDAVAYSHRGIAKAAAGKMVDAAADLSKAIELAPADGRLYFNRGLVHAMAKDRDKAAADFAIALEHDSGLLADVEKAMKANGIAGRSKPN